LDGPADCCDFERESVYFYERRIRGTMPSST
jgi:hypothetical protein